MRQHCVDWEKVDPILKMDDVARVLKIGRNAAYELAHRKGFPVVNLGQKRMRVTRDALKRWLEEQEEQQDV